ncbi:glutamate receptor 2.8-like isoform X1 [Salvia hispanica]|uniref:glutamate receptor 2.8-like isoform X1 n=2 Tax=Salvia hispanica TaxID=49212 RepID=UPI002009D461|nr:glutamate receptor 2.8-like isoform X1 [Salvia hispanica]
MQTPQLFWLHMLLFMCLCIDPLSGFNATAAKANVGIILDLDGTVGKICKTCISMAIEDFYSNRDYNTMIEPHFRDSRSDVVTAASAAIDLLKNTQVMAIIGPQRSIQADFVIDIGDKVEVPIISTATSPSVSLKNSSYFIRSAWSSSSQVKPIAAIVKKFGWREVVFVYEDSTYGSGLVPYLTVDLLKSNAVISQQSVISSNATEDQIRQELGKLMKMRTRVFVVHMLPGLASRFFKVAKEAGMMGKGYAWLIVDVLTSLLDSMDPQTMEAMQGVIGVKAYVPKSVELINFEKRWRKRFHMENPEMDRTELNIFGLWSYDSITVLAEAIERAGVTSPQFNRSVDGANLTDLGAIGTSLAGPPLLGWIRNHMARGLSGDFNISNGQLQPSAFRIVNVNGGKEISIGFWSEQCGISRELKPYDHQDDCLTGKENLDPIVWPGKENIVPKGWELAVNGEKFRVGVTAKIGFNEFLKVEKNEETGVVQATGFCIDVFEKVWENIPYSVPVEYVALGTEYRSNDEIMQKLDGKDLDAFVADITVTASRSKYIDFTFPYSESGVGIVVPIKPNERKNAWIFMKPLTTGLWLTIGAFVVYTGFVIWVLEHRVNKAFRGPPNQQVGMIFWFSFSTLVFAQREKVRSNLTRFVVIVWVFVVLVLTSSYTANLTSMLTVDQLQPKINSVNDLIKNGEFVGHQIGSFVSEFLTNNGIVESANLRSYSNVDQFHEALSKGSRNGGVGAIIDELPYIRLLLSKHCDKYTMIGPIYPTSGFGFAFPKGSPLVFDVSHEILRLKEDTDLMVRITEKWLGDEKDCPNANGALSKSQRLNLDSFKGLFLIAGVSSTLALAIFLSSFLYENRYLLESTASTKEKLLGLARIFSREKDESLSSKETTHPSEVGISVAASPAMSIPCDQDQGMFSQDEGFSTVEIFVKQRRQETYS